MNPYETMASKIVHEQEQIIGPIAWTEAEKVNGLTVERNRKHVTITETDHEKCKVILDRLVAQYEQFFGAVSHEVCRDAVRSIINSLPPTDVPESLK